MQNLISYFSSDEENNEEDVCFSEKDFFSLNEKRIEELASESKKEKTVNCAEVILNHKFEKNTDSIPYKEINECKKKLSQGEWSFGTFSNHSISQKEIYDSSNYVLETSNSNSSNHGYGAQNDINTSTNTKKYVSKRKIIESTSDLKENPLKKLSQDKTSKLLLEEEYCCIGNVSQKLPVQKIPRKLMGKFKSHTATVGRLRWCGHDLSHLLLSTSFDCTIQVHDIFTKQCRLCIKHHTQAVRDATWSHDNFSVSSCGYDNKCLITDITTGQLKMHHEHKDHLTCVKHHPDQQHLLVVGSHDMILCLDTRSPQKAVNCFKFKDKMGQVLDVCFLSPNELLSSCDLVAREGADRSLVVWDFRSTAALSNQIFHEKYTCPRLLQHPSNDTFLAQTQGNYIAQFNCSPPYKLNKRKQFNKHLVSGWDVGCDVDRTGSVLVSGSADGRVVFYKYSSTNLISSIDIHPFNHPHTDQISADDDVVTDVAWHPVLPATCAFCTHAGVVAVLN